MPIAREGHGRHDARRALLDDGLVGLVEARRVRRPQPLGHGARDRGLVGRGEVGLVDDDRVGQLEDARFFPLHVVAALRLQQQDDQNRSRQRPESEPEKVCNKPRCSTHGRSYDSIAAS